MTNGKKRGSLTLKWLLSSVAFIALFSKTASALVYRNQAYVGFTAFGGQDIAAVYQFYSGWIDFFIYFLMFFSLCVGIFPRRFGDRAGRGLSIAMALFLSLSLILYQYNTGFSLLQHAHSLPLLLLIVGVWALTYALLRKVGAPLAALIASIVTILVVMFTGAATGMPIGVLAEATQQNIASLWSTPLGIIVSLLLLLLLPLRMWTAMGNAGRSGSGWLGKKALGAGIGATKGIGKGAWWTGGKLWNLWRNRRNRRRQRRPGAERPEDPLDEDELNNAREELVHRCRNIIQRLNQLRGQLEGYLQDQEFVRTDMGQAVEQLIARCNTQIERIQECLDLLEQ